MITEVQITCIVIMTLMSFILAFILPRFVWMGKTYDTSRKMLVAGSALVALHFLVQFILVTRVHDFVHIRTAVNLLFGFPITFFINMSLIFLLRRGRVRKRLWYFIPVCYLMACFCFIYFQLTEVYPDNWTYANSSMAFFYAIVLFFSAVVELRTFIRIERSIYRKSNRSYIPIIRWTKWSILLMTLVSLGFPFMTFSLNMTYRAVFGMLSIIAGFFYMICFLGYGLTRTRNGRSASLLSDDFIPTEKKDAGTAASGQEPFFNPVRAKQIELSVNDFIRNEIYTLPGLTIKEAAQKMGISVTLLKAWLRTTEYGKFSTWVQSLRIEKSKEMIRKNPAVPDEETARACGFCNRQYFQKLFREKEGFTPFEWGRHLSGN